MSDGNVEYGLMEPFDIDGGELDGVRPQVVFCLGYEWCQLSGLLDLGKPLRRTVHTENVSRIKRMCIRRGRKFRVQEAPDTQGEWTFLDVADTDGEFIEDDDGENQAPAD